jgi:hypothetical protein
LDAGLAAWLSAPQAAVAALPGAGRASVERVPGEVIWYRIGPTEPVSPLP